MKKLIRDLARRFPAVDLAARTMLAALPRGSRLGPDFVRWYALFGQAEAWDRQRIDDFRHELLVDLIRALASGNPYYARLIGGAAPEAVALDLARHFPITDRDAFRAHQAELGGAGHGERLSSASTSGTSGNALQFFHTVADNGREWAAICHQWRRVGYDPLTSRRAELRGLVTTRGIVQHFPESRMVRFSVLHLKAEHIRHYAEACAARNIEFLHGYPSAIYVMAREMLAAGIRIPQIRGVLLASEMVYGNQVETIAAAFPDARLIAHYGNAERVALGAWCEKRRDYHFLPLYSWVETDRDGALIGTNLFNTVNPFVRYRMTDVVSGARDAVCPDCGRLAMSLAEVIEGRAEDYLYSPEKGWIPPAIVTYPLKSLRVIREIQFLQDRPDALELRYTAPEGADCAAELASVRDGLAGIMGTIAVRTVRVDGLERGPSGKMKWIVSTLSPERAP